MPGETKGRADPIDHLVSKRLKMRRMMLGLSQQQLGEAVDVSIQQVQKYEKAINRISSGKLYIFARRLGVPVGYFFDGNEDNILEHVLAEEGAEYQGEEKAISEKEVINLIRAFSEIKNSHARKKIVELVKTIS